MRPVPFKIGGSSAFLQENALGTFQNRGIRCIFAGNCYRLNWIDMADNYLEKKMEDMQNRLAAKKAKEQRARERAWKKRMDAYRKKLEAERLLAESGEQPE